MKKSLKYRFIQALFSWFGRISTPKRLRIGAYLAAIMPYVALRRTHIVRTNLKLCFPDADAATLRRWEKEHLRLFTQSMIDRGLLWYGDPERIKQEVSISGFEHIDDLVQAKHPLLMLAPHFIGLDAAATRISMGLREACTMYKPQRDTDFDEMIRLGRGRFNEIHLLSRKDGIRGIIRYMRRGVPVYYLPDMDFGRDESIFVPFFSIPSATLPSTAQIAKSFNAKVVPIVTQLDIKTGHYHVEVLPALENFPGEQSIEEATARINQELEQWILRDVPQYYWVHRRFKTRPEGEAEVY